MEQPRVLAKEEYTIGWVCALPIELVAARHMLDEIHASVQEQDASDHNSYVLGCVSQHNVVVAALPAGVYGTNPAATVANNMLRTFPSIRFGLLVGIGGAAPSPSHDIRLGDVVVSRPSTTNGGVIQYDRGKLTPKGIITRTGSLNSPPTLLLTTMSNLESLHAGTESQILPFLEDMFKRFPKLRKQYACPGTAHDHLFQADYPHLANSPTCDACDLQREVSREPRDEAGPEIHYGSIASSNQVVKDAVIRDRLRDELDVLCFEMEAAGLTQDFPCLVIRGICDYADTHKNKQWQKYAAAVAAAYAKEFLSIIPAARIQQENSVAELKDTLTEYTKDARHHHHLQAMHNLQQAAHNQRWETHYQSDKHRDCHRAFKTSNYEEHKNVNPDRVDGTCRWVLDHPKFKDWRDRTGSDLLWISADPGCGKSVLVKSLIDHDLKTPTTMSGHSLCYFFFKDNPGQDHLATALCAILHQLFTQQPLLIRHAIPIWEKTGELLKSAVDALWRILEDAASDSGTKSLTCIFDALDECRDDDRPGLVEKLCALYEQSVGSVGGQRSLKFLVTSRAYHTIQDGFRAIPASLPSIRLRGEDKTDQIHQEINLVIHHEVITMAKNMKLNVRTKRRIEETLLHMEHRTYLWLHLTLGEIQTRLTGNLRPHQAPIDLLPTSVEEAYDQILQRVTGEQEENVKKILSIVVGARRALTIAEMAVALGIATGPYASKQLSDLVIDEDHLWRNIRQWCGLFIFINHSRIYLIHQTAKEFLLKSNNISFYHLSGWKHSLSPIAIEDIMARVCVGLLLSPDLEKYLSEFILTTTTAFEVQVEKEDYSDDEIRHQGQGGVKSFMAYCAENWAVHLQLSNLQTEDSFMELVSILYETDSERFKLWFPIFWKATRGSDYPTKITKLQLAALNGHDRALHLFLSKGAPDLDAIGNAGQTALTWASEMGHTKAVQLLVEQGADVNVQGGTYGNALQTAAFYGRQQIAQLLIENGADVNAQGGACGNALQAASYAEEEQIIRLLLQNNVDVNIQGGKYGSALQAACFCKDEKIAQLLLENGADVHASGGEFGNALQVASYLGHTQIMRVLIENGADVDALAIYLKSGKQDVPQLLIELGTRMKIVTKKGWTPLHLAVSSGCLDVIEPLIELGTAIDAQTSTGSTALHLSFYSGSRDMVMLLMKLGADPTLVDAYGHTCLDWSASDSDLLEKFEQLGYPYQPTPVAVRKECLQRSVLRSVRSLREESERNLLPYNFHTLGHFLLFLSHKEHALTAFRLQVFYLEGENRPFHDVRCNICEAYPIYGVRFVCKQCADVDLCASCLGLYQQEDKLSMCRNHKFLEVPPNPRDEEFARNVLKLTEKMKDWLQNLEDAATHSLRADGYEEYDSD